VTPVPRRTPAGAAVLETRLRGFRGELTVADAAARGGLALRDAEAALLHLSSEYRGHLKATEAGELVFSFPRGLHKPVDQRPAVRALRAIGRVVRGVGRFVVRAWVSVVMVGYAAVLAAILIALALKDDDGDGIGEAVFVVLRIVGEALFWTFHPFSPFRFDREPGWLHSTRRRPRRRINRGPAWVRGELEASRKPFAGEVPFYEKVNRFVFGPTLPEPDPRLRERQIVAEIRRLDGRIGPGDVMRVVGGTREEAEALLCRLVVDYDGSVEISEDGAVVYQFAALLKTADESVEHGRAPAPIWTKREIAPPLTGNASGTNVLLGAINGFNLAASGYVMANHLTMQRIGEIIMSAGEALPPATGTPLLLGAVPLVFSSALFALPAARALRRRGRLRIVASENGRRGLLQAVLSAEQGVIDGAQARLAWQRGGGTQIDEHALTAEVRLLGGEPDVNDEGKIVYKFADLASERLALSAARSTVSPADRAVAPVAFSSDSQDKPPG